MDIPTSPGLSLISHCPSFAAFNQDSTGHQPHSKAFLAELTKIYSENLSRKEVFQHLYNFLCDNADKPWLQAGRARASQLSDAKDATEGKRTDADDDDWVLKASAFLVTPNQSQDFLAEANALILAFEQSAASEATAGDAKAGEAKAGGVMTSKDLVGRRISGSGRDTNAHNLNGKWMRMAEMKCRPGPIKRASAEEQAVTLANRLAAAVAAQQGSVDEKSCVQVCCCTDCAGVTIIYRRF